MLRALALAVLLIVTALPVSAGFKEGMAAYGRGDQLSLGAIDPPCAEV